MFTYAESLSHNTEREYSATVNEIGGRRQDMGEGLLLNQREPYSIGTMFQGVPYHTILSGSILQNGLEHGFLSHIALTFTHLQGDAGLLRNVHRNKKED